MTRFANLTPKKICHPTPPKILRTIPQKTKKMSPQPYKQFSHPTQKLFRKFLSFSESVVSISLPSHSRKKCLAYVNSDGSRVSLRWGREHSGGHEHTILPKSFKKLHEIERIWTPGGGCVPHAPLRSATGKAKNTKF